MFPSEMNSTISYLCWQVGFKYNTKNHQQLIFSMMFKHVSNADDAHLVNDYG